MVIRATILTALVFFLPKGVQAQEPEQLPVPREVPGQNVLPPPRVLGPMPFFPYAPPDPPPQFGRRDVWQYFAVDSTGRFVPRVIYSPYGSYYLYNRRPFPYTTTQPRLVQGTIVD
jgi:hypothetical protein